MPSTDFLTYGYAALVATGGLIGYVKAGNLFIYSPLFASPASAVVYITITTFESCKI